MSSCTVFVPAQHKAVGRDKKVKKVTGEFEKGLFGKKEKTVTETQFEQTGWSDHEIDGSQLQKDLQKVLTDLDSDGFEVVTVTPITSGNYSWGKGSQGNIGGYGYGYGYSYTEGVLVTARKV